MFVVFEDGDTGKKSARFIVKPLRYIGLFTFTIKTIPVNRQDRSVFALRYLPSCQRESSN